MADEETATERFARDTAFKTVDGDDNHEDGQDRFDRTYAQQDSERTDREYVETDGDSALSDYIDSL